ncbi:hypothetical protein DFH11DRAFT_1809923 [Phellopilus nigrolimitatus]|nr:hypothetical protein DFH11DRAFT_1809923 [Phellopilus nigrolimitatus]
MGDTETVSRRARTCLSASRARSVLSRQLWDRQTQTPSTRSSNPASTVRHVQTASAVRRTSKRPERLLWPNDVAEILDPISAAELVVSCIPSAVSSTAARAPPPISDHAMPTASGRSDTDAASAPAAAGSKINSNSRRQRPAPRYRARHSARLQNRPRHALRGTRHAVPAVDGSPSSATLSVPVKAITKSAEDRRAERAQNGEGVQRVNSGSGREGRGRAGRRGSRNRAKCDGLAGAASLRTQERVPAKGWAFVRSPVIPDAALGMDTQSQHRSWTLYSRSSTAGTRVRPPQGADLFGLDEKIVFVGMCARDRVRFTLPSHFLFVFIANALCLNLDRLDSDLRRDHTLF